MGDAAEKLNVMYVIWWEGCVRSGLLRNQVYEPLKLLAGYDKQVKITLVSAAPFFKVRLREWLLGFSWLSRHISNAHVRNAQHRATLKDEMAHAGIEVLFRETLLAPRSIYMNWVWLLFFPWVHLWFLRSVIRKRKIDVIHCRSYSSTWVVLLCKILFSLDVAVVFDTRGLVPEEAVFSGVLKSSSWSFRLWKRVEHWLLEHADIIINVSETLTEHIRTITGNSQVYTVQTNVDIKAIMEECAMPDVPWKGRPTLVYMGDISYMMWHSVENLAHQMNALKLCHDDAFLLIISKTDREYIRKILAQQGIREADYIQLTTNSIQETARYLKTAQYAALPFRGNLSEVGQLLGYTMIASKTGEYLAAGLPVICNDHIGAASCLVLKNNLGVVCSSDVEPKAFRMQLARVDDEYVDVQHRCMLLAETFSSDEHAKAYLALYQKAVGRVS